MPKRVLHICDNLYYGGAQMVMIATINELPEFEHFVVYLAKYEELKPMIKCPSYFIEQKPGIKILSTVKQVRRFVKDNSIDIIHCNVFNSMMIGRAVAFLSPSVKQITTYHGMSYLPSLPGSKKWAFIDKFLYKKRFINIAVSQTVKNHLLEQISRHRKIEVVTNSVSNEFFSAEKKTFDLFKPTLKFVTIANNFPLKNIKYLLDVFSNLEEDKFELHIYGGRMEPLIEKTTQLKNVFFYGIQPIKGDLLKQYDIYISSSLTEGCPLSVMEAMAIGLPTPLSTIDAFKEITDNRGFFFDPYDTDSGKNELKKIYGNQYLLKEFSKHNFEVAKNFSPSIFAEKIRNIYLKK